MLLLDATNAEAYLRESGRIAPGERVTVRELAGGVSNVVLLVEFLGEARESFVLKQAREQLRVAQPWFCSPERIWTEVAALKACEGLTQDPTCGPPRVLFEDHDNFAFAMEAAPAEAVTWKSLLLAREHRPGISAQLGSRLARIQVACAANPAIAERFADQRFFHDLRIDPYYREIARRHPSIAPQIDELIDSLHAHRWTLVHGDFSPKNILLTKKQVLIIDWEVAHYGDAAFDVAFCLSHMLLKAFHLRHARPLHYGSSIYSAYLTELRWSSQDLKDFDARVVAHLRALLLARVDGKSPAEYLSEAERDHVRRRALEWFDQPPCTVEEALGFPPIEYGRFDRQ